DRAAVRHHRSAYRQAHRLRRRRARPGRARAPGLVRRDGRRLRALPDANGRPDGGGGRRRNHAAEIHLVRAEARRRHGHSRAGSPDARGRAGSLALLSSPFVRRLFCGLSPTKRSPPAAPATSSSADLRPSFLSLSILACSSSAFATASCAISTMTSPGAKRLSAAGEFASTPVMMTPLTVSLIL